MKIEIRDVTKAIGRQKVLDGISLEMVSGRVYGLQGINGSGKTMLMRAIIGLIRPTSGSIIIDGKRLGKDIEFPESIGFLLENPSFLDRYSGFKNLELLAAVRHRVTTVRIREVIAAAGLDPDDKKKYRKYSLGMKQRLGIAAAIMESPDILILDEPANALDTSGVAMLSRLVRAEKERGALVIISCHDHELLSMLSDTIFQIENGRIVSEKNFNESEF